MATVRWISRGNIDRIEKELDFLKKHTVWVGFVDDKADKKVNGVEIWLYANFNEYGSDNVPSRPFFRTAINDNRRYIKEELKRLLQKVALGEMKGEVALKSIGLEVQGMIQDSIKNGNWTPNAQSTKDAKGGKGQELIDTGSMLRAVSFEIRRR
jgi:hypothetical protein